MSESMAGVTFLAFGNGSPDVFSTFAAMNSHSGSLAVGELIGAAGFITAVVAGSMALVREFKVGKKSFVRDVGFFIVAASFSMVFLADGALHLWECCVMIGFYVFYVITVVAWHWYLTRKRVRKERDAAARGQYLAVSNEEIEVQEEDDDGDAVTGSGRYRDAEDFAALERGASPAFDDDSDDDGDGDRGMQLQSEMASSMRVTRPYGLRRNTITPIRPSLVGALEFRSVLSSLQKSRGSHARPIHLRRYSDDPSQASSIGGQVHEPYLDDPSAAVGTIAEDAVEGQTRTRAVSMNDARGLALPNPAAFTVANVPDIGLVASTPTFPKNFGSPATNELSENIPPKSPTLSIPASPMSRDASPAPSHERYGNTLAPPGEGFPGARQLRSDFASDNESPQYSPRTRSRPAGRPRLQIPGPSSRDSSHSRTLSPAIQFPPYTDSPLPMSAISSKAPSLILPEAVTLTPESTHISHDLEEQQERPISWWPYRFLPSPHVLASTLFPTLYTWREKSIWDKFVSVISAPSIFLLAITLPVVESESQEDEEEVDSAMPSRQASHIRGMSSGPALTPESPLLEPEWIRYRRATQSSIDQPRSAPRSPYLGAYDDHNSAAVAVSIENLHNHHNHQNDVQGSSAPLKQDVPDPLDIQHDLPRDWNRWLVSLQIFTAPFFVVTIVWANTEDGGIRLFAQLVLYSLLGSLIAFGILILTTTPTQPPKYRFLLCFLGFVVAIAWISTIANEVVGVLKAFGVILGISDAILGLTIFAVGNSLGDLVADITVARLGYPVMALSACFGGPMLNILLGIGISGLYMTIKEADANHHKHPGRKMKYKPYAIEVSGTLIVSGISLLVTLVGLLIVVPLNKWVMSRRIGWGLIILWSISTVINLGVEISGAWGDV